MERDCLSLSVSESMTAICQFHRLFSALCSVAFWSVCAFKIVFPPDVPGTFSPRNFFSRKVCQAQNTALILGEKLEKPAKEARFEKYPTIEILDGLITAL